MKEKIRVPGSGLDTIYFRGNPHLLQNVSFVRDPEQNCQVVIFATMTPVAVPEARQAIVDDILKQNIDLICHYCADPIGTDFVDEDGNLYCCQDCADDHLRGDYVVNSSTQKTQK